MSYPHIVYKWQMLLPFDVVEDVKPYKLLVAMHYIYGRCYCQLADGMATADGF